jgi:hypothetical protein
MAFRRPNEEATMKARNGIAVAAMAASAAAGIVTASATGAAASSITTASTHASHQLPAWIRWGWASTSSRAHCHGGPAVELWVAGHPHRGVTACEENQIFWPGGSARTRSAHTPPGWLHWTQASANSDCLRGPKVILWIRDGDQSAEACNTNGVILPS